MITEEKEIEKMCSIYASEFHLEMIMLPYINKKIDEDAKIVIMTEKNLKETMKMVLARINLSNDRKKEIRKINWKNTSIKELKATVEKNKNKETVIFVVGNENYIKDINKSIEEVKEDKTVKIIDCYSFEEIQGNMAELIAKYPKMLNTATTSC